MYFGIWRNTKFSDRSCYGKAYFNIMYRELLPKPDGGGISKIL